CVYCPFLHSFPTRRSSDLIVAVLLIQLFWFFGLHGQIIINSVFDPIWYALNDENLQAFQAGGELPNIVTKQFIDTFLVGMGGSGDRKSTRLNSSHVSISYA